MPCKHGIVNKRAEKRRVTWPRSKPWNNAHPIQRGEKHNKLGAQGRNSMDESSKSNKHTPCKPSLVVVQRGMGSLAPWPCGWACACGVTTLNLFPTQDARQARPWRRNAPPPHPPLVVICNLPPLANPLHPCIVPSHSLPATNSHYFCLENNIPATLRYHHGVHRLKMPHGGLCRLGWPMSLHVGSHLAAFLHVDRRGRGCVPHAQGPSLFWTCSEAAQAL